MTPIDSQQNKVTASHLIPIRTCQYSIADIREQQHNYNNTIKCPIHSLMLFVIFVHMYKHVCAVCVHILLFSIINILAFIASNCSVECAVGSLKEMFIPSFKAMLELYSGQVCVQMDCMCSKQT